jgi:hypothetical protein
MTINIFGFGKRANIVFRSNHLTYADQPTVESVYRERKWRPSSVTFNVMGALALGDPRNWDLAERYGDAQKIRFQRRKSM